MILNSFVLLSLHSVVDKNLKNFMQGNYSNYTAYFIFGLILVLISMFYKSESNAKIKKTKKSVN